jgi:hypothetical protein
METLIFSGHDTFHCRQFWLKKAYDFTKNGYDFNNDEAVLELGVGKNMVTAIRYWAKCFGVIDKDNNPTGVAEKLLSDNGWDPYLEDFGSLWLLHHELVTGERAPTFSIIFNELIRERPEFDADTYTKFIATRKGDYNENTLKKDFTVFYKTYYADFKSSDIEDSFTGILTELNLIKQLKKTFLDSEGKARAKDVLLIERQSRNEIPLHILLYGIIAQNPGEVSISFDKLYNEPNGIGSVFALSREGLTEALERISSELKYGVIFSNEAGVRELQFKKVLKQEKILKDYYGK